MVEQPTYSKPSHHVQHLPPEEKQQEEASKTLDAGTDISTENGVYVLMHSFCLSTLIGTLPTHHTMLHLIHLQTQMRKVLSTLCLKKAEVLKKVNQLIELYSQTGAFGTLHMSHLPTQRWVCCLICDNYVLRPIVSLPGKLCLMLCVHNFSRTRNSNTVSSRSILSVSLPTNV